MLSESDYHAVGPIDVPTHPPYRPGMNRRRFLLTSLAGALAAPLAAEAQSGAKPARIGYLAVSLAANPASHEAFLGATQAGGSTRHEGRCSHPAGRRPCTHTEGNP
jgi:hypothetical protein